MIARTSELVTPDFVCSMKVLDCDRLDASASSSSGVALGDFDDDLKP